MLIEEIAWYYWCLTIQLPTVAALRIRLPAALRIVTPCNPIAHWTKAPTELSTKSRYPTLLVLHPDYLRIAPGKHLGFFDQRQDFGNSHIIHLNQLFVLHGRRIVAISSMNNSCALLISPSLEPQRASKDPLWRIFARRFGKRCHWDYSYRLLMLLNLGAALVWTGH